jgi:NAD(P)-dependent dehydrogenase (short-subunit alcohol dehydrogenase family)
VRGATITRGVLSRRLASLDDVRCLADEVTSADDRLDILINAGIGFGPPGGRRQSSRDGHELRFAVNYLAPFLLTHLLLPTLRRSTPSQIVNVASIGQAHGRTRDRDGSTVPTIVPETWQNSASRANASQLDRSVKWKRVKDLRGKSKMSERRIYV